MLKSPSPGSEGLLGLISPPSSSQPRMRDWAWRRVAREMAMRVMGILKQIGFEERVRGSHHIFSRDGVPEILNLQPRGRYAKSYQVKQIRDVILKHRLGGGGDEE